MLLAKEWPTRPVHIALRPPEIVDRNHNPCRKRLILPSPPVIPQSPNHPQQQRRRHNVKQTEQPNKQRQSGIKHIFGSANEMPSADNRPEQSDGGEGWKQQQPTSLPRKQQRSRQP